VEAFALGDFTDLFCCDLGNGNHGGLARQYATQTYVVKAGTRILPEFERLKAGPDNPALNTSTPK
jgi:hypothetical protein